MAAQQWQAREKEEDEADLSFDQEEMDDVENDPQQSAHRDGR